ncbi:MAG: hypothetical protein Q8R90_03295 [Bacteroidales bacterium]|nr:hypothetical protein [Bacteroidales bacterium]
MARVVDLAYFCGFSQQISFVYLSGAYKNPSNTWLVHPHTLAYSLLPADLKRVVTFPMSLYLDEISRRDSLGRTKFNLRIIALQ